MSEQFARRFDQGTVSIEAGRTKVSRRHDSCLQGVSAFRTQSIEQTRQARVSGGASDAHDDRLPTGKFNLVNLVPCSRRESRDSLGQASRHLRRYRGSQFCAGRSFFGSILHVRSDSLRGILARRKRLEFCNSAAPSIVSFSPRAGHFPSAPESRQFPNQPALGVCATSGRWPHRRTWPVR